MKLKNYIAAVSLFATSLGSMLPAFGCGPSPYRPYSYNPFCVIEPLNTSTYGGSEKAQNETISFWKNYLKGEVSEKEITQYFANARFDDLLPENGSKLMRRLQALNDQKAIEYIQDCLKFNKLSDDFEGSGWEYAERDPAVLRTFAQRIEQRKGGKVFGPRYDLLKMRVAGLLRDDEKVLNIWKTKGRNMSPGSLRDRMGGFVGGVLYRQGNYPEALDYFYSAGDNNSIAWCVSKILGPVNLQKLYEHDPNSNATLYALNDYMNFLISGSMAGRANQTDDEWCENERLSDALRHRRDFIALCNRVLSEGICDNPMAWAMAKGALQLTLGEKTEGLKTLVDARKMKGSPTMKKNLDHFELWALLLNSGMGDNDIDNRMLTLLEKVYDEAREESLKEVNNFDRNIVDKEAAPEMTTPYLFLTTFFAKEATTHFKEISHPEWALAVMGMMEDLPIAPLGGSGMFQNDMRQDIFRNLDDKDALSFLTLMDTPATSMLDRYFSKYAAKYRNLANEAYATRLLCRNDFNGALAYLKNIDTKWLPSLAIYPYLSRYIPRYYYDFQREETGAGRWSPYYPTNYKAMFCRQMLEDMEKYEKETGNRRAEAAYRIASLYHYASPQGDCWAISDYSWSVVSPTNAFNDESLKWLRKALRDASDKELKCKIYYAILSSPEIDTAGGVHYAFGSTGEFDGPVRYYWDNRSALNSEAADYLMDNYSIVKENYQMSRCDVLRDYAASRFVAKPTYGW